MVLDVNNNMLLLLRPYSRKPHFGLTYLHRIVSQRAQHMERNQIQPLEFFTPFVISSHRSLRKSRRHRWI